MKSFLHILMHLVVAISVPSNLRSRSNTMSLEHSESAMTSVKFEGTKLMMEIGRSILNVGKPDMNTRHSIVIAIQPKNENRLDQILDEVTNPKNKRFGHFLSRNEILDLTVDSEASRRVYEWLKQASVARELVVTSLYERCGYVKVDGPIWAMNELLNTEFYLFNHSDMDSSAIRALSYTIPADLVKYIGAVFHTIQHPYAKYHVGNNALHTKTKRHATDTPINFSKKISDDYSHEFAFFTYPQLLKKHYDIFLTGTNSSPTQGVFASIEQSYSIDDLSTFENVFQLPSTDLIHNHGDHVQKGCKYPEKCFEANLDIQYITAIGQGIPTHFWYENDLSTSSFTMFLIAVNNDADPPKVISISYAMCECLLTNTDKYFFDLEAKKLAIRGITLVAASGDSGVSSAYYSSMCGYNPIFPASSAYVTTVGATQGIEMHRPETTCQSNRGGVITSGGGFSNLYTTPRWQKQAVEAYLERVRYHNRSDGNISYVLVPYERKDGDRDDFIPNSSRKKFENLTEHSAYPYGSYNRGGRGYPDISLAAVNYLTVVSGRFISLSGTSASTPVFAGMIALINAARVRDGKTTVGWINPVLYSSEVGFATDILEGDNTCYGFGSSEACCKEGFHSTVGWDPVTGFGAVKFRMLYDILYNLPNGGKHSADGRTKFDYHGLNGSSAQDQYGRSNVKTFYYLNVSMAYALLQLLAIFCLLSVFYRWFFRLQYIDLREYPLNDCQIWQKSQIERSLSSNVDLETRFQYDYIYDELSPCTYH